MWLGGTHIVGVLCHSSHQTLYLLSDMQSQLIIIANPLPSYVGGNWGPGALWAALGHTASQWQGWISTQWVRTLASLLFSSPWSLPEETLIVQKSDDFVSWEVKRRQRAQPGGSQLIVHVTVILFLVRWSKEEEYREETVGSHDTLKPSICLTGHWFTPTRAGSGQVNGKAFNMGRIATVFLRDWKIPLSKHHLWLMSWSQHWSLGSPAPLLTSKPSVFS